MPEMHLRQPGFTCSANGPFPKRKFFETGNSQYIYQNELDKACFQHDMAYGDFKDLARKTASGKLLHDKALNIDKNPKYDRHQRGLASMVSKFFEEKTSGGAIKNKNIFNKYSTEELLKSIIRKGKKQKVHWPFWGWYGINKGTYFVLCVFDIFSKYAWVIPLNSRKGITITNAFQIIFDESNWKPKKIWVDKGSKFYNRWIKLWLEKYGIKIYSTHNERKKSCCWKIY